MKRNARHAFNALKKAGVSVLEGKGWGGEYSHFDISGENGDLNGIDYYSDYWGERGVVPGILNKYGLYFEWVNPGVAAVYDS